MFCLLDGSYADIVKDKQKEQMLWEKVQQMSSGLLCTIKSFCMHNI